jgi:Tetratricopeptide repeat
MFDLLTTIWNQFWEATILEKVGFLSAVVALPSAIAWFGGRFGVKALTHRLDIAKETIERLTKDLALAREKLGKAEAERDALSPDHWLRVSAKEQTQGNEEKAMAVLADGFAGVRSGMAHTALALAGHHLSQVIGSDRAFHLDEGERFARIAALLDPEDADAAALAEEAAMERIDDGEDVDVPELRASYLPSDHEEATALIYALCNNANRKRIEGQYRLGYRLARRAELVSRRAGLYDQEWGCLARFWVAQMLDLLGDARAAADTLKSLLLVKERTKGAERRDVFAIRWLEARVLDHLGEHRQALDRLKSLLPVQERVQGAEHRDVLNVRHLEAEVLNNLGEHQQALDSLKSLLPVEERVRGIEHPDILGTRYLEARVLDNLGEYRQALDRLTALLPAYERVLGAEHPDVISARALRDKIHVNIAHNNLHATPANAGVAGAGRETS